MNQKYICIDVIMQVALTPDSHLHEFVIALFFLLLEHCRLADIVTVKLLHLCYYDILSTEK